MKKVIVIGLGEEFVNFYAKRFPFGCFEIVCASDFDEELGKNAKLIHTQFMMIDDAINLEYDFIIISSKSEFNRYYERLLENDNIERKKILGEKDIEGFTVDKNFCYQEFKFSFGDLNPDKYFYIIRPTYSIGLFACAGRALAEYAYATSKGWIPVVDMQNYPNMYLANEELYKKNSWEKFFLQFCDYPLEEVYSSKNVILGDVRNARKAENWVKGGNVYKNGLWSKVIILNPQVEIELEEEEKRIFGKANGQEILGVLLRGTDYISLQPENHPIQPSSADMIKIVNEKRKEWNCKYIYLSTEDKGILRDFQRVFGTRLLYTNQVRYENTGEKYLASIKTERDDDETKRGREYLITIILLSRCDYLITSKCGGGNVVKMINGDQYKEQITIDKGNYGKGNKVTTIFEAKCLVIVGNKKKIEQVAELFYSKYGKSIFIISNEDVKTKFTRINSIEEVEKPYGIIAEDEDKEIEKLSDWFRTEEINFSHYSFLLTNTVNIKVLKLMKTFTYKDEKNNEIKICSDTSDKIIIAYHNAAMNTLTRLGKVRVTESLKLDFYGNQGTIEVEDGTSFFSTIMAVTANGLIKLGKDCLISYSTGFYQNDNHCIFDFESKQRINCGKNIVVGNHVWIEREVMLLAGAHIADNCIVGSRTVTSSNFQEKNVIVAGQPGRIIRRNIVWARDDQILDYEEYSMCNDKVALKYMEEN